MLVLLLFSVYFKCFSRTRWLLELSLAVVALPMTALINCKEDLFRVIVFWPAKYLAILVDCF
jgi:hypothetical protein